MASQQPTRSGRVEADLGGFEGEGTSEAHAAIWRLATALSAAETPNAVATAFAAFGASTAGASFANMAIFNSLTNRVQAVHDEYLDARISARWAEFGLERDTPLSDAILSGSPVLLVNLDAVAANYPQLLSDTTEAGLAATASLPLRSRSGAAIGAVGFGWQSAHAFTTRQMSRLNLVAQLASEALERATCTAPAAKGGTDLAKTLVLQEAFLPTALPRTEHLELAAAYLPAIDAPMGGDWYDAFTVDDGTCLVIGDVAGHGVRCVSVMVQLRNAVRAFADEDPTPQRVVSRVNRMLCRLHPTEMATLTVAVWNPESQTLVSTNAGHPPALRCRSGEFAFLPETRGDVALGAIPDWSYGQFAKVLRPGSTLLFYTDGLIERRSEDFAVSMERLRGYAEQRTDLAPQPLCDDVLTWRLMQGDRIDDVCILAARLA